MAGAPMILSKIPTVDGGLVSRASNVTTAEIVYRTWKPSWTTVDH